MPRVSSTSFDYHDGPVFVLIGSAGALETLSRLVSYFLEKCGLENAPDALDLSFLGPDHWAGKSMFERAVKSQLQLSTLLLRGNYLFTDIHLDDVQEMMAAMRNLKKVDVSLNMFPGKHMQKLADACSARGIELVSD